MHRKCETVSVDKLDYIDKGVSVKAEDEITRITFIKYEACTTCKADVVPMDDDNFCPKCSNYNTNV